MGGLDGSFLSSPYLAPCSLVSWFPVQLVSPACCPSHQGRVGLDNRASDAGHSNCQRPLEPITSLFLSILLDVYLLKYIFKISL